MARITFTAENKIESTAGFPKLRLEKDGERARIACVEDPERVYVHTLRMPKLENGKAVMKSHERKDGSTFEKPVMEFVGQPLCLGDESTLEERGVDEKNCPACAASRKSDEIEAPRRRYAMHVVRYNLKANSFEVQSPFGVNVVVWSFTDKTFNILADYAVEWGSLQKHDLLLGPCEDVTFQKFDIKIASSAEWAKDETRKATLIETFKENQTDDLAAVCGRRTKIDWMKADIDKVHARYLQISGRSVPDATAAAEAPSLTQGLSSLMEDAASVAAGAAPAPTPVAVPEETGGVVDLSDLSSLLRDI